MSKIGNFNLEMTEKVNELGYDTVEEAIADGWDSNEFYASYHEVKRDEQEKAHEAWLKEKQVVVGDLKNLLIHGVFDFDIIKHALDFIEGCKSE